MFVREEKQRHPAASHDKSPVDENRKSRFFQTPNFSSVLWVQNTSEALTPTFLSSSPTMFRAEILADVVRGVPERLSPAGTQQLINVEIIKSNIYKHSGTADITECFADLH